MMNPLKAQQGLERIIVEKYYVADENDATDAADNGAVTPLKAGAVTYRVFADLAPGYKFIQMYGDANHDFKVNTTTSFYNDPNFGTVFPQGTSVNNTKKNTSLIDSWFSVGGVATGKMGVLKTEDTDGSIGNNQGLLANDAGGDFGAPITGANGKDGMVPGTPVTPNVLGLSSELDIFDQTDGNSFLTNNGTIVALGGVQGPTASNIVLLGQFTTDGELSFELNIQLGTPTAGGSELYVAKNPVGNEIAFPELSYKSSTAANEELVVAKPSVTVEPNPTQNTFTLNIDKAVKGKANYFTIQNVAGNTIESNTLGVVNDNFTKTVDLSAYPAGIYFVTVTLGEKVSTLKVVKN